MAKQIAKLGTFHATTKETVDGAQTTKYVGNPPLSKLDFLLPLSLQALPAGKLSKADTTLTLWVDDSGLLHRSSAVVAVPGDPITQTLVNYSKWGKPVKVALPPASQVQSLPKAVASSK
jgi:hypothetical protein